MVRTIIEGYVCNATDPFDFLLWATKQAMHIVKDDRLISLHNSELVIWYIHEKYGGKITHPLIVPMSLSVLFERIESAVLRAPIARKCVLYNICRDHLIVEGQRIR